MENRETIQIITPIGKHKVILNSWITGKERRELRRPILEGVKFGIEGRVGIKEDLNSVKMVEEAENLALEKIVVSIDGDKERIVEQVLDMRAKDSEFVINKVIAIRDLKDEDFLE